MDNMNMEMDNMNMETIIAQRKVIDCIKKNGVQLDVISVSKVLLQNVRKTYSCH